MENFALSHTSQFEKKFPILYKNVKNVLTETDLESFGKSIVNDDIRTLYNLYIPQGKMPDDVVSVRNLLFYRWLAKQKLAKSYPLIEAGCFFLSSYWPSSVCDSDKGPDFKYILIKTHPFKGRIISFDNKTTCGPEAKDLRMLCILNEEYNYIKDQILAAGTSVYKIHLMPTQESLYPLLVALVDLINNNPQVSENLHFNDLISNIKVHINTEKQYENPNDIIATVVIYIPTLFMDEANVNALKKSEQKANFLNENLKNFINYKKSKKYTIQLLKFLMHFFKNKPDIKGSGIVPRYNQQVTDLIYFAQGHGDDKNTYINYFTENKIYFKSNITGQEEDYIIRQDSLVNEKIETFKKKFPILYRNVEHLLLPGDLESFYQYLEGKDTKTIRASFLENNKQPDDVKEVRNLLFYCWLFNSKIEKNNGIIDAKNMYFAFSNVDTCLINIKDRLNYEIKNAFLFKGKCIAVSYEQSQLRNLELAFGLCHNNPALEHIKKNIVRLAASVYKIHLMPTTESLYSTLLSLVYLIKQNPRITEKLSFLDLIHNIKVNINGPTEHKGEVLPTIVIYVPNLFISQEQLKNFNRPEWCMGKEFFNHYYKNFVNYKKSKKYTIILLQFLMRFFKNKPDIKGSGITPRYNQKVTDLIYFAQGNGDDKKSSLAFSKLFTEDKVHFSSEISGQKENYIIDVNTLDSQNNDTNKLSSKSKRNCSNMYQLLSDFFYIFKIFLGVIWQNNNAFYFLFTI